MSITKNKLLILFARYLPGAAGGSVYVPARDHEWSRGVSED